MSRDPYDALIDQLLREVLGGDRPRDITARVLAQAKIHDRFRRRWWVGGSSAIAACLAIAAGLAFYWPRDYPNPRVTDGTVYSANSGDIQRGVMLETDDDNEGSLNIGNYINLTMGPQTALTLGGTRFQEKVFLNRGHVDVQVAKNKGRFDVAVGQALVHVTGTRFGLDVQDGLDETQTKRVKTLFVNVDEGSVDVQGVQGIQAPKTLKAGSRESFIISSEPVPVIKSGAVTPPPATASAAPARPRQGIGAGAQEGARIGGRGLPRPAETNPGRGGLLGGQNQNTASMVRSMLMVVGTGRLEQTGSLRLVGELFYLETERGNYLLFPRATPTLPNFKPVTSGPIRVIWEGGKIISIEPVVPASRPI